MCSRIKAILLITAISLGLTCKPIPPVEPKITEISFTTEVINKIKTQVALVLPNEYAGCLYGTVRNDTLYILEVKPAKILQSGNNGILYDPDEESNGCEHTKYYLGPIHSHILLSPIQSCALSVPDDYACFLKDSEAILATVFCTNGQLFGHLRNGDYFLLNWRNTGG